MSFVDTVIVHALDNGARGSVYDEADAALSLNRFSTSTVRGHS